VLATFGRGFYVLDNYSPLRELSHDTVEKEAHLFEIKDAQMFIQTSNKSNQGDTYYKAPNPPFGATFTYYIKEVPKTQKQLRKEKEKELFEKGDPIPQPTWRELQLEEKAEPSHLIFTVYDEGGNVVRQLTKSPSKGMNRINWDLRYSIPTAVRTNNFNPASGGNRGNGILVLPGNYSVDMKLWHEGAITELAGPVDFSVKKLNLATLPAVDYSENVEFNEKAGKLAIAMVGSNRLIDELISKVEHFKEAIYSTPGASQQLMDKARELGKELEELNFKMNGVPAKASGEEVPPAQVPLYDRLGHVTRATASSTSGLTTTQIEGFEILEEEFPSVLEALKRIVKQDIPAMETELNKINAPWTPGRLPVWNK